MKKIKKAAIGLCGALAIAVVAAAIGGALIAEPNVRINGFSRFDPARLETLSASALVSDCKGEPIGKQASGGRIFTPLCALPDFVAKAFVAVEDKRFFSHSGVDYGRIAAAAVRDLKAGKAVEGASTITQQLVKITHLGPEKTIRRKVNEIRLAREIERKYTKDEILEAYLNALYFGSGMYGIGAVARSLFGKDACDLCLSEAALLAGMINNPAKFDPKRAPEEAKKRRDLVLSRMAEQNYISEEEFAIASAEPIGTAVYSPAIKQYAECAVSEAAGILGTERDSVFAGGYTINTFLEPEIQQETERLIAENDDNNSNMIILVARNSDGRFVAGAADISGDFSQRKRSPGSAIKPMLCYAPALETKNAYLCTPILDEKTAFGEWRPSNYRDEYHGWVSVKESLVRSLNIPAIKLLETCGIENAKRIAGRFGIEFSPADSSLSLALGAMNDGVTLPALADAYRTLANGGMYSKGSFVSSIVDKNGKTVFCNKTAPKRRAISEDNAFLLTSALVECAARGTARQVGYCGYEAAAKTGTVGSREGNTDAYCIAYTPEYTVAVWMGVTSGRMSNDRSGGGMPSYLARRVLEFLGDGGRFVRPKGVVGAQIDLNALKKDHKVLLAGSGTKQIDRSDELFSAAHMPRRYSAPRSYIIKSSAEVCPNAV